MPTLHFLTESIKNNPIYKLCSGLDAASSVNYGLEMDGFAGGPPASVCDAQITLFDDHAFRKKILSAQVALTSLLLRYLICSSALWLFTGLSVNLNYMPITLVMMSIAVGYAVYAVASYLPKRAFLKKAEEYQHWYSKQSAPFIEEPVSPFALAIHRSCVDKGYMSAPERAAISLIESYRIA